jgi:hypothetical protein
MGEIMANKNDKENELLWELIFILFSVSLGFSVINANNAGIFVPGDFLYHILGTKTIEAAKIYSSFLFLALIFVNLFLIATWWKREWINKFNNFYFRFFLSFFIGISPMYFYYFTLLIAKYWLNMGGL